LSVTKQQMLEYETSIEEVLKNLVVPDKDGNRDLVPPKKGLVRKNQYHINLKAYLQKITGVNLTAIDGLNEINLLQIIARRRRSNLSASTNNSEDLGSCPVPLGFPAVA